MQIEKGQRFGLYTVVDQTRQKVAGLIHFLCRCDCGVERLVNKYSLLSKRSRGCGCVRNTETGVRSTTHGLSKSPIYAVWCAMLQRCTNPESKQWADYGGRGIKVCEGWLVFETFLEDMGPTPFDGAMLERKDNDQGYEPDNVVWADRTTQNRNKRNTRKFSFQGVEKTLPEWAQELKISKATLASRIYIYGWTVEKAFTTPVKT